MAIPFGTFTPQATRKQYRFSDRANVHPHVVVSQPGGQGPITVYVPPIGDDLPFTQTFSTMGDAQAFADQQSRLGSKSYSTTKDGVEWWLTNLTAAQ